MEITWTYVISKSQLCFTCSERCSFCIRRHFWKRIRQSCSQTYTCLKHCREILCLIKQMGIIKHWRCPEISRLFMDTTWWLWLNCNPWRNKRQLYIWGTFCYWLQERVSRTKVCKLSFLYRNGSFGLQKGREHIVPLRRD